MEHTFTNKIYEILKKYFGNTFKEVFERSQMSYPK